MLSRDPEHDVRNYVVTNPAAPDRLIDAAVGDRHEHVRGWALSRTRNLEIIQRAARSNADDRRWVANNPHCPPETLARLAGDPDAQVRGGVAQNRACPEHLNRQLQTDRTATSPTSPASCPADPNPDLRRTCHELALPSGHASLFRELRN
jgi:hypothetical protein